MKKLIVLLAALIVVVGARAQELSIEKDALGNTVVRDEDGRKLGSVENVFRKEGGLKVIDIDRDIFGDVKIRGLMGGKAFVIEIDDDIFRNHHKVFRRYYRPDRHHVWYRDRDRDHHRNHDRDRDRNRGRGNHRGHRR